VPNEGAAADDIVRSGPNDTNERAPGKVQSRRDFFEHSEKTSREDDHEQRLLTTWLYAAQHAESFWGGGIIIVPVVEDTMLPRPLHWNRDFDWSIVD